MIKNLLFKIAKGTSMGKMGGNTFRYCSWAIPVKKLYSDKNILAFYHPSPSYENHVIVSPKRAISNLQQMNNEPCEQYFLKIWDAIRCISEEHREYHNSLAVVANGGKRQEVQQVHFHMFSNHAIVNMYVQGNNTENIVYQDENICIVEHPNPNWDVHFVIKSSSSNEVGNEEKREAYFKGVLRGIEVLNEEFKIVDRGYSLVYQCNKYCDINCSIYHIVSGNKHFDC